MSPHSGPCASRVLSPYGPQGVLPESIEVPDAILE